MKNWAGNFTYGASAWHRPRSVEELQRLVAETPKIRAVGTRHSFSRVADTDGGALVSLENFQEFELDEAARTVVIGAGLSYGELAIQLHRLSRFLHAKGWALHNLASLPHINVVGAVSTATHGSGDGNGNLATAVRALERVRADGSLEMLSGADLEAQVVGLGRLGIVTSVTLEIQPAYEVEQNVYEGLAFETLLANFDEITSCGYSVSLFTDWASGQCALWRKRREFSPAPKTLFGATLADGTRHPIPGVDPINCTEQNWPGLWHTRLPHFKLEFTPSFGEELQSEFFVGREHAREALEAVYALREKIAPLLLISELRTVKKDALWLSPHYGRDSLGIHFTFRPDGSAVQNLLPEIEAALAPFGARPHPGKLHTRPASLPRQADFEALCAQIDPDGKFSSTASA